jgi:uncharacterized protein YcbK (DUF882 family)
MAFFLAIGFALFHGVVDFAHVLVPAPAPATATATDPAAVTLYFQNRHEEQTFALLDENDAIQPDALKSLSRFVRCWRTERVKPMNPRLVEIVARIARHYGTRIEVVSGYRARPYGAPHSKHFLGNAMDLHIEGVAAKKVARWVWQNFRHVGVGYYPKQDFMHVDVREVDVRWIDQARHGESAHARYFGRPPSEEPLPPDAPLLAYDVKAEQDARSVAIALATTQLPWPN